MFSTVLRGAAAIAALATACSAAAERQYAITYLPLPQDHHTEAIAINTGGDVLIRDYGVMYPCCSGLLARVYFWSEKTGLIPVVDYTPLSSFQNVFLNDHGEVAGIRLNTIFIWSAKQGLRELATFTLGGITGFNNRGEIVGNIYFNNIPNGFLLSERRGLQLLGSPLGPSGINDKGTIVGAIMTESQQAFVSIEKLGIQNIGAPAGFPYSLGLSVNSRGDVLGIGRQQIGNLFTWTLFTWSDGAITGRLQKPDCLGLGPTLFNGQAEVAFSCAPPNALYRVYFWSPGGSMREIGSLGASAAAYALSDAGDIVGSSQPRIGIAPHPFVWSPLSGITDLAPEAYTGVAYAINDKGTIAGAVATGDHSRACVWRSHRPQQ